MKDYASCPKKGANYKKVSFVANVMFVSILVGTIGYNNFERDRKEKIYDSLYIGFSEVREIEYGTPNYDTLEFVEKVDNGVIDSYTREIDTSTIGVQELKYEITESDVTKKYSIQVEIKDTKLPVIEFNKDIITIYEGNNYDFNSNIKSVRDEVDGDLVYSDVALESPNEGYYLITSDYNKNKVGSYSVVVNAYDRNGNETVAQYTIKVIKKPVPKVVTTKATGTYTGPSSVDTSSVVSAARSFLGMRYVYASANPSVGFDCSGLVYYVYGLFGKSLPRTTKGLRYVGNAVSEENMQPGDIIVWSDNGGYSATHVAIYVGGGQMIHAANRRDGVIQSSVSGWKSGGKNIIIAVRRV